MCKDYTKQLTEILIELKNINDNIFRCQENTKSNNVEVSTEKYPQKLVDDMREIYKAVLRKVRQSGKTDEVDTLVIRLYKTEFEQNTVEKE